VEDTGLFFWLIVFAVAILQGIGQKKKQPGQRGRRPPGKGLPPGSPRPTDQDEQELEQIEQGMAGSSGSSPTASADAGSDEEADASAEGMIPQDVWAEILGLARGEAPKRGAPKPEPSAEDADVGYDDGPYRAEEPAVSVPERRPREPRPREPRTREVRPRTAEPFSVERSRDDTAEVVPAWGETVSGSPPAASLDASAEATGRRVRDQDEAPRDGSPPRVHLFGSGSVLELRKAVILQEVLGPPVGLKEEENS